MRFATIETSTGSHVVLISGDSFLPIINYQTLQEIIDGGTATLEEIQRYASDTDTQPIAPLEGTFLAPLPQPRKNIVCVGMNYAAHARESLIAKGLDPVLPQHPVFFTKPPTSINSHNGVIFINEHVSNKIDWEAELGIIIGKRGKNIPLEDAMDYIWGYTIINDISARDLQKRHGQFFKGKSLDGSCPIGPWVVTADEISDPHNLAIQLRINGVTKQSASTNDLIFDVPTIIHVLSQGMTIEPGDIIATGTPAGVGFARQPAEYLQPGDIVETEIEGIGILRNTVAAED